MAKTKSKTPTKKPINSNELNEIEFIKNLLRKGFKRKELLQSFTKSYKGRSVKTFDNRLKVARTQMVDEIKKIENRTEQSITKEVEARKLKIMTIAERIDILSKIADGEIPLQKAMVCNGKIELIDVVPDWSDRRNAIAELNKMDGSYAPTKTDLTSKGESINPTIDVSHLSAAEIKSLLNETDTGTT